MAGPTIYHNPRCSKSRATLELLRQQGGEPKVVEYLEQPPSTGELAQICRLLGIRPRELVRDREAVFEELYAGADLDDAGWLEALATHPVLIQRPIVIAGDRAVIGRPPERVLELVGDR